MNEITFRNDSLGLSMTKTQVNGIDVVWAENVREALEWDRTTNMIYGLKEGKEVLKVRISDLKSEVWNFLKFEKVKKNTLYAYFLTRQGVARLIATRRPHDIKANPELAQKLDRLQDWIFGEVLPEVMTTGRYSGRPLVAGHHAIEEMARDCKKSELFAMLAETAKQCEEQEQKLLSQAKTIDNQGQTISHLNEQVGQYATGFVYWAPLKEQPEGATRRRGAWVRPRKRKNDTDNLLF